MVKIGVVVLSLALVLSIQFVEGDENKEVLTHEQEHSVYLLFFETVLNNLVDAKVVDGPKVRSEHAKEQIRKAIEMAEATEKIRKPIQMAKATKKGELAQGKELNVSEEKKLFGLSLGYLVEELAKAGLVDRDVVYKKFFPEGPQEISPEIDAVINKIITSKENTKGTASSPIA